MHNKYLGVVTDHWVLSGITTATTGSPFTPSFGTNPTVDVTGSSSLGARIQVVGAGPSSVHGANYRQPNIGQTTYFIGRLYRTGRRPASSAPVSILMVPGT